jgi:hypothetical protein
MVVSIVAGPPVIYGAAQHAAAFDGKPVIAFIMSDGNVCKYGPGGWC